MQPHLRVNMADMSVKREATPKKYEGLGGRLLIAKILNEEIDAKCDPLGKENKLIVCTGLLAGTPVTTAHRISVGAKSPLTGGIKEANAGGMIGPHMAKHGLSAIIIEGKPEKGLWILHISDSGAKLIPADEYKAQNTYELFDKLHTKYGNKAAIMGIGSAGERQYNIAAIMVSSIEGHPTRAAARGGLGAVMASKGIKAIVIDNPVKAVETQYADKALFTEFNKKLIAAVQEDPLSGGALPALGTPVLVNVVNSLGCLVVKNFSDGQFAGAESLSGEFLKEQQDKRGGTGRHACQPGCVIKCSMDHIDADGKYVTSALEYETIVLLGSNIGIDDLDTVAKLDRICDDIGIDTIDAGVVIGVCMEGGKASFGDVDGAFALMKEMVDGTDFGKSMGAGANVVGKQLGVKRIPTVKGQGLAAYDPRAMKGTGVSYCMSAQGADHTSGHTLGHPAIDPTKKEGTVPVVKSMQVAMATVDTLGVCLFSSFCWGANPDSLGYVCGVLQGRYGGTWDVDKAMALGIEALKLEKEFNKKAGFTIADDKLADFFYNEPLNPTGSVFDFTSEEMQDAIPS